MRKNRSNQRKHQTGEIRLWHILLAVVVAVLIAIQWRREGFPFPQISNLFHRVSTSTLTRQQPTEQSRVVEPAGRVRYTDDAYYNRSSVSVTPIEQAPVVQPSTETSIWSTITGSNNSSSTYTVQEEQPTPTAHKVRRSPRTYYTQRPTTTTIVSDTPDDLPYELAYPIHLRDGYYTVQVFSGYNSRAAYDIRSSLRRDGYTAVIREESQAKGILFKVRVGYYKNRSDAFAVRSQIQRRYPSKLAESFVIMVN